MFKHFGFQSGRDTNKFEAFEQCASCLLYTSQVPMLEFVKEAFLMEKDRQELLGLHCEATVDGYTDFVFRCV